MNKKYIKVSLSILVISLIFIFGNKIIFKDLVYVQDATDIYDKDISFTLDKKYTSKDGINLRIKIDNPTKHIYRLEDMNLIFEQDGGEPASYLKIEFPHAWEETDLNYKPIRDGIQPYSSDYIEFIIPKGLNLDSEYFNLDNISIEYNARITINIPFTNGAYTTIGQRGGTRTILDLSLSELSK